MQTSPILHETGYLRLPQVLALFPVSRSTWWAGVRAGRYPKPVKLGPRITAWTALSIRRLLDATDAAPTSPASPNRSRQLQ